MQATGIAKTKSDVISVKDDVAIIILIFHLLM
jgi:hypothetical protein